MPGLYSQNFARNRLEISPKIDFFLFWVSVLAGTRRAWPRISIHVICLGYFLQKRPTFCRKVAKET